MEFLSKLISSLLLVFTLSCAEFDYIAQALTTYKGAKLLVGPKDFFQKSTDREIADFLQHYPQAFYGLLYRVKPSEMVDKLFANWENIAQKPSLATPSLLHLQSKETYKPLSFFTNLNFLEYYMQAWFKEQELCNDYYLFYHGQQGFLGFYQEFTTALIEALHQVRLLKHKLPDDFFFIQNPEMMNHVIDQSLPSYFLINQNQEQSDMMNGRSFAKEPSRKINRFAANAFMFANSDRLGSCTWSYVLNNSNVRYVQLSIEHECFTKLSLAPTIYQHYCDEIQQLYNEFTTKFASSGRLLQIAVPKAIIDQVAYLSSDAGYKDPVYTRAGEQVKTVSEFFMHLEQGDQAVYKVHAPSTSYRPGIYEVEFTLPLTTDKMLNPHSGIKVFSYTGLDKEAYQVYKKQEEALCEKIAQYALIYG
jgi:hypothetical protein